MPTKRKRPSTTKKLQKKRPKLKESTPNPKEQYLLALIEGSERAISGDSACLDEFFLNQTDRLKRELQDLRSKK